ncbi:MAG TPA: hypothetical protein VN833_07375, partial [Candidatus Acidoferrales bacterium]|nr:hypothetical protein [Candidatus Acidoferrales bacterium]
NAVLDGHRDPVELFSPQPSKARSLLTRGTFSAKAWAMSILKAVKLIFKLRMPAGRRRYGASGRR